MNRRHPLALVAACSVLLAAVPLTSMFQSLTWLLYAGLGVAVVVGSAMLTRAARGPVWAQVLVMMGALLLFVTVCFPSHHEFLGLIPTGDTFIHFNDLLVLAGDQIRTQAVPVPDLDALILLTTLGICLVAIVVDLVAVGLRRPALAGLPMLAIYSVPVAVLPDGVPVITFIFAAVGYLWLLVTDSVDRVRRFGRRFTGEGRDVDIWEPSPLAAAGRRLGLVGLVVAIILPLAVPGLSSGLLDMFRQTPRGPGGGIGTGSGSTVDLSAYLTDQLLLRNTITTMVKVTTTDPNPYYLRFAVSDVIQQNGFMARSNTGDPVNGIPPFSGTADVPGVTTRGYKATVQVLDFKMPFAPTYQQVTKVDGLDDNWLFDQRANVIFASSGNAVNKRYTLEYVHIQYTPEALRTAPQLTQEDRALTVVPANTQVTNLVKEIVGDSTNEYDQVRALYDYFTKPENNFTYSFQAPADKTGNPIVDFLEAKRGFCVQYAAAMAWLSRVAGYPSRVAVGFTKGTGANAAGQYTLTNANLHAWTEVYFPNFGWVPFDTTPASAVPGSVQSLWAPDPTKPIGPSASAGPSTTPSVEPSEQDPNKTDAGGPTGGGTQTPSILLEPWVLGGIALLVVLVILAVTPAMRRRALTRRRLARSRQTIDLNIGDGSGQSPGSVVGAPVTDPAAIATARRDAHAAWAELHDTMLDFNVDIVDAETPRVTADRVGTHLSQPDWREQARLLARAEERARYAQLPLHADGLNQAVRAVRTGLAERATKWERFTARFFPRSVVLRWRLAVINRVANAVAAAGRARAALGVANPRRALSRSR